MNRTDHSFYKGAAEARTYQLPAIGTVHSCYKEKFGIPRQPGLAPDSYGVIEFLPPYNQPDAVRGLEKNSHIWVQFIFHQCLRKQWKPTVRPPRLGGNERLGVFATRATFRPNPIGLSVVRLEHVDCSEGSVRLHISGLDLVEGTPVLDIKPYIPYVDSISSAQSAFAPDAPVKHRVCWKPAAWEALQGYEQRHGKIQSLIEQVLQQDPRPAYRHGKKDDRIYGITLMAANIRFYYAPDARTTEPVIWVVGVEY